jgi:hypothetical protein
VLPGRSHPFMHEHVPPWPHESHVLMFCATSTSSFLFRQHRSPFPVARLHDPRHSHFLHTSKMASPGHTLQSAAVVVRVVVGVVMATVAALVVAVVVGASLVVVDVSTAFVAGVLMFGGVMLSVVALMGVFVAMPAPVPAPAPVPDPRTHLQSAPLRDKNSHTVAAAAWHRLSLPMHLPTSALGSVGFGMATVVKA